jgi:signal transduction histidine kinase
VIGTAPLSAGRAPFERSALLAFRLAILGLISLVAFEWATRLRAMTLAALPTTAPQREPVAWGLAVVAASCFAVFGAASWVTTGRIEGGRPPRRSLLLLVFQLLVGWGGCFEMLVLVALQAPFLLTGRALALFWAVSGFVPAGQALLALVAGDSGVPEAAAPPGLQSLSPLAAWALTRLYVLVWMAVGAAIGWLAARAVRSWRDLQRVNAEVRASRELLAENARVAERLRVSREVHDVLGHHLAALTQHLELARRRSEGEAADEVARALEMVRGLLERLRSAVATMRRPATLEVGSALRTLADAAGARGTVVSLPDAVRLPPVRAEVLFDCAREAVGSAVLAGGCPGMSLQVQHRDSGQVLTLSVDSLQSRRPSEEVLRSLRERLGAVGGALRAEARGEAFRMQVELPDGEAAS